MPLKYLKRGAWAALSVAALACSHKPPPQEEAKPRPTVALPTGGLAGQQVIVLPFTLLAAEDSLGWDKKLADRRAALFHADSILGALLQARVPEVVWLLPDVLRRAARRAPGLAVDPDQVETNFVFLDVGPLGLAPAEASRKLADAGVRLSDTVHPTILRAVTHLGISDEDVDRAAELVPLALGAARASV